MIRILAAITVCLLFHWSHSSNAQEWQNLHAPSDGPMACSADGTLLMSLMVDPSLPCNLDLNVSTNSGLSWFGPLDAGGSAIAASADGARWIVANPLCGDLLYSYSPAFGFSSATPANVSSSLAATCGDGTRLAVAGFYYGSSQTDVGVQVSTNSGASWQSVLTNVGIISLALSANGMTLAGGAGSNVVFLSTNFGVSWSTNIIDQQFSGSWNAVACSADGTRVFAASADGIFMSSDAGRSWVRIHDPDTFQSMAVSADGTRLAAGAKPAIVYRSDGIGANWTRSDLGQTNASNTTVAMSADGSQIYAGTQYYGLYSFQTTPAAPMLTLVTGSANLTVLWTYPGKKLRAPDFDGPGDKFLGRCSECPSPKCG
jgi:hypothetical protein